MNRSSATFDFVTLATLMSDNDVENLSLVSEWGLLDRVKALAPLETDREELVAALSVACLRGRLAVVQYLVEDLAMTEEEVLYGHSLGVLNVAVMAGQTKVARWLTEKFSPGMSDEKKRRFKIMRSNWRLRAPTVVNAELGRWLETLPLP